MQLESEKDKTQMGSELTEISVNRKKAQNDEKQRRAAAKWNVSSVDRLDQEQVRSRRSAHDTDKAMRIVDLHFHVLFNGLA